MCLQFPQFECTFWYPFAFCVENVRQPNYFLHKNKCIGYFIHDLHLEKVLLFVVVMDSVERWEVLGRVAHTGYVCIMMRSEGFL